MKFKYQARNQSGELQVGYVEAKGKNSASEILEKHSLFVLSLEEERKSGFADKLGHFMHRIKVKDLMIFTRQLSTLIEADISLDDALMSLYKQTKNPLLKESIFQIIQDIESGLSLSQALERQKPIFSDFYVSMVRSAEVTGRLEKTMSFLADYIEKEAKWHAKIMGALLYPAILMVVFLGVVIMMVVVVFPKLAPVFKGANIDLPWETKLILGFGTFIINWWWLVLIIMSVLIFIIYDYVKSSEGKIVVGQVLLILPVFGKLFKKMYVVRFARSISVLIKGGIPMAQSLAITADTIGNQTYKEAVIKISKGVQEGATLSKLLENDLDHFPPMVSQMAIVGESTGRIDEMMERVSDFYNEEVDNMMANLGELIQPIFILAIGLMVGILFASILMPIYNLAQSVRM